MKSGGGGWELGCPMVASCPAPLRPAAPPAPQRASSPPPPPPPHHHHFLPALHLLPSLIAPTTQPDTDTAQPGSPAWEPPKTANQHPSRGRPSAAQRSAAQRTSPCSSLSASSPAASTVNRCIHLAASSSSRLRASSAARAISASCGRTESEQQRWARPRPAQASCQAVFLCLLPPQHSRAAGLYPAQDSAGRDIIHNLLPAAPAAPGRRAAGHASTPAPLPAPRAPHLSRHAWLRMPAARGAQRQEAARVGCK